MKTLKNIMLIGLLILATSVFSQSKEVEFDIYTTSASKASRYLLVDHVSLRDCPAAQCQQLTTIAIGTYVRLLEKSERPQTIDGVTSRWYKVKMGPQIGWIWGGLISQKTMVSNTNPEIRFVFGEAGLDSNSQQQFQIRAIKNGVELDKILLKSNTLTYSGIELLKNQNQDIISLSSNEDGNFNVIDSPMYVVFKDNSFQKMTSLTSSTEVKDEAFQYVYAPECEN
ncbi:SH3 domain-containing protein [Gelidibacter maritimus]|uniref:SH3 domain-containing protein n=1 Tax=Gelidibacter maritimus TaxID=2761487 RepID=A0A7W2M6Z2_9FLAO|nr:SH3 domain-containing protein [Gelidibacter maritimus]MBA6153856.1 SH3 domain-containing protein [Gelidibacter maritimus]